MVSVTLASARVVFAVWHADAAGIYSDESVENTTGQTSLRGCRITDSSGAVTFKTIVPGW
jgi:protocatechuate 3,4-dioxygenase beta subunit